MGSPVDLILAKLASIVYRFQVFDIPVSCNEKIIKQALHKNATSFLFHPVSGIFRLKLHYTNIVYKRIDVSPRENSVPVTDN